MSRISSFANSMSRGATSGMLKAPLPPPKPKSKPTISPHLSSVMVSNNGDHSPKVTSSSLFKNITGFNRNLGVSGSSHSELQKTRPVFVGSLHGASPYHSAKQAVEQGLILDSPSIKHTTSLTASSPVSTTTSGGSASHLAGNHSVPVSVQKDDGPSNLSHDIARQSADSSRRSSVSSFNAFHTDIQEESAFRGPRPEKVESVFSKIGRKLEKKMHSLKTKIQGKIGSKKETLQNKKSVSLPNPYPIDVQLKSANSLKKDYSSEDAGILTSISQSAGVLNASGVLHPRHKGEEPLPLIAQELRDYMHTRGISLPPKGS